MTKPPVRNLRGADDSPWQNNCPGAAHGENSKPDGHTAAESDVLNHRRMRRELLPLWWPRPNVQATFFYLMNALGVS